jgi:prepilin-type N-terminal cleavage/methylation domain-containing protein
MKNVSKQGFSLVELLLVMTIMGILGTIGYQFGAKAMMKAKAQKVASTFKNIQKSIADTMGQAGGYYQSTGTTNEGVGTASPQPLPSPIAGQTCGLNAGSIPDNVTIEYLDNGNPVTDNSCFGQRIENALHNKLVEVGIKWEKSTKDFRLPSAPLAHISFPFEVNGVRSIRIWGIQGDLAFNVFQTLTEGTKNFTNQDGWSTQRPIAIVKFTAADTGAKYGAGTETACLNNLDALDTVEKSFNCLATGDTTGARTDAFYKAGEEEKAKNAPKVILYYTYSFGYDDTTGTNDNKEDNNDNG